jgi:hypothetical protein
MIERLAGPPGPLQKLLRVAMDLQRRRLYHHGSNSSHDYFSLLAGRGARRTRRLGGPAATTNDRGKPRRPEGGVGLTDLLGAGAVTPR